MDRHLNQLLQASRVHGQIQPEDLYSEPGRGCEYLLGTAEIPRRVAQFLQRVGHPLVDRVGDVEKQLATDQAFQTKVSNSRAREHQRETDLSVISKVHMLKFT